MSTFPSVTFSLNVSLKPSPLPLSLSGRQAIWKHNVILGELAGKCCLLVVYSGIHIRFGEGSVDVEEERRFSAGSLKCYLNMKSLSGGSRTGSSDWRHSRDGRGCEINYPLICKTCIPNLLPSTPSVTLTTLSLKSSSRLCYREMKQQCSAYLFKCDIAGKKRKWSAFWLKMKQLLNKQTRN